MDSVLAAIFVIFVILFAVFTFSDAFITSQDTFRAAWQEMQDRLDTQARTSLLPLSGQTTGFGSVFEVTFRNDGQIKLIGFDKWDLIAHYFDGAAPAGYHITWAAYTAGAASGSNQWDTAGLYRDAAQQVAEVFEPGVLNPGEEFILRFQASPPAGAGQPIQVVLSTASGAAVSIGFNANLPPVLTTNTGFTLANGGQKTVETAHLATTDGDDPAEELVYTVTTPPAQGTLNPAASFTQADLDGGLLSYTHTGTGDDSFEFTVTDGKDTIGPFTFTIMISLPPTLATNAGLSLAVGGTAAIDQARLKTTDPDDLPDDLVYTVTTPPAQGTLSLGSSFTQDDVNNGLLSYTHTGSNSGSDSFAFSVSDGETTIGPFTFIFTVY